ncbi:MAG: extracellular solute-binding protein [Paenibacillaceae bacterium]|nr:extracellular solute-binding protein [Paenibacillaceae bacterium]
MKQMKTKPNGLALTVASSLLLCTVAACAKGGGEASTSPSPSASSASSAASASPQANVYPENGLPKDQKVTLKFGFFEGGMGRAYIDYAMDTFKKKFPNVSFDVTYSPDITKITSVKVSANNDADMFDMFSGSVTGGIDPLVAAGKLEPMEDLWSRKPYDGGSKTLKELAISGGFESTPRVNSITYSLPIAGSGNGLFYNKSLFEKNGWNQNPKTWEEFLQLCQAIKAKNIIPITYPGQFPAYMDHAFGPAKLFELADLKGTAQKFETDYRNINLPQFLSPESVELWNRIYTLGKSGYIPAGVAALTHTQAQMQMLQGEAAMVSTGVYVQNEMKDAVPKDFKWGFMAVPMGDKPDSVKWIRSSVGNGQYIWAAKPELNKKWAKEFTVWLWSLDVQAQIVQTGGLLPIRKDFMDDAARAAQLQDAPKAMFDYMNRNKVMLVNQSRAALSDPAYAQALKVMTDATSQIATGKQDPLPKLQEAEALMKKAVEAKAK